MVVTQPEISFPSSSAFSNKRFILCLEADGSLNPQAPGFPK